MQLTLYAEAQEPNCAEENPMSYLLYKNFRNMLTPVQVVSNSKSKLSLGRVFLNPKNKQKRTLRVLGVLKWYQ